MKDPRARGWSTLSVALACLLPFAILPALVVGAMQYRSHAATVQTLSQKIMSDVSLRVMMAVNQELSMAHATLNTLLQSTPLPAQLARTRDLIDKPDLFEAAAYPLVSLHPQVTAVFMGSALGEFRSIQALPGSSEGLARVTSKEARDPQYNQFDTRHAGDRKQPLPPTSALADPRTLPWYVTAIEARQRVTTPVRTSDVGCQLFVSLSQPVFDEHNGSVGVLGVDLFLQDLHDALRVVTISRRGAAFIVDDDGYLVASSAGDDLCREDGSLRTRLTPNSSGSPVIRRAWQQLSERVLERSEDSVSHTKFAGTIKTPEGALLVSMQSFGNQQNLPLTLLVAAPELDFAEEAEQSLRQSMLVLAAVLAVGVALALLIAWRLTSRLRVLTEAAETVGHGRIPELPDNLSSREFQQLAHALRSGAEEIVHGRNALLQANETLEHRVQLRTSELAVARDGALAAARAKAAFLATMSHEIRTPLNGVVGMTMLLADTPLNAEQRDYLHTMRVSSDQLLSVINDILDYSKIESGKLGIESEPLNLQATIEEACDIAAPRAREKGLELLIDIGDELPTWVRGDITRLRQVLLNFVNNAVKFTEQGQIVLSAHLLEDFDESRETDSGALIEFRVTDTGIGIPADRQGALFQSFTQVDASTTRRYGGSGLGLAICKRLAELMGGGVGLESEPGKGSTFWFTARMAYADTPASSESSLLEMASLTNKLAVIVDDTPLNLRILDKQLKRWHMRTVAFARAQQALDWLSTNSADVVLTDMYMPEMDGEQFAKTLRERKPDAHIILLTSGTMPTGEAARPFDARLLKPYRQAQLFGAIMRVTFLGQEQPPPRRSRRADKGMLTIAAAPARHQLILVVDDNAVNLKVAISMLVKLGYESAVAVNGQEAADLVSLSLQAQGRPFAAVLMDANMPVLDGYAASRLIRRTHGTKAPPIIALTASVLEEDRRRCYEAGMIGFLPKPLRIDELSEALALYIKTPAQTLKTVALDPDAAVSHSAGPAPGQDKPADAPKDAAVLMDWSRLAEFKEFDDEQYSMTREVIRLFIEDAPRRLQDIRLARQTVDVASLSRAAHALKGSASNVGATALADACYVLEQTCKQGIWPDDVDSQMVRIASLCEQTVEALAQFELS